MITYDDACEKVYINEIAYEWTVDSARWKKSLNPIRSAYNKAVVKNYLLGIIIVWIMFAIGLIRYYAIEGYLDSDFVRAIKYVGFSVSMLFIIIVLFAIGTKIGKSKRGSFVFFLTQRKAMYTGWGYCTEIYKYRLSESEEKISLYITQDFTDAFIAQWFRKKSDRKTLTAWTDFYFDEKDKVSIFSVLFQWEKNGDFYPDTPLDQQRLHACIGV